jgi:hypothetical protein
MTYRMHHLVRRKVWEDVFSHFIEHLSHRSAGHFQVQSDMGDTLIGLPLL